MTFTHVQSKLLKQKIADLYKNGKTIEEINFLLKEELKQYKNSISYIKVVLRSFDCKLPKTDNQNENIKRNNELIDEYLNNEDVSISSLKDKYGITRQRVCQILHSHNVKIVRRKSPVAKRLLSLKDEIEKDYLNGFTSEELSKKYKIGVITLRNSLSHIKTKKQKEKEVRNEKIREDYKNGMSYTNLIIKYKSNLMSIRNILKDLIGMDRILAPKSKKTYSQKFIDKVKEEYKNGLGYSEIIIKYKVNQNTIAKWIKDLPKHKRWGN